MNRIKMILTGAVAVASAALAVPASADTSAVPASSGAGQTLLRVTAQAGLPMYSAPHSDTYWVGTLRDGEWITIYLGDTRLMPDGRWCHILNHNGFGGEHYSDTVAWVRGLSC